MDSKQNHSSRLNRIRFSPRSGSVQVLSDVLKRYEYAKADQAITLENSDSDFKSSESRFFWLGGNPKYDPKKLISFKETIQNGKTIGNLAVNTGSPFIFLSNSFFFYPWRNLGASVPGYSAYFLQHIPDWFYQESWLAQNNG